MRCLSIGQSRKCKGLDAKCAKFKNKFRERRRCNLTDFEGKVLEELAVLKSQMQSLIGIGQPGRLHELEERVASHERSVQRLKGLAGAFGGLLTLVHLGIAWVSRK